MTTPLWRAAHPHARRGLRVGCAAAHDPHLACDRRHVVLVAAHRRARPVVPPSWLRWLADRVQPGRKVF